VVEPLEIHVVPISELTPDPKNARIHKRKSLNALCESLTTFGQRKPILITRDKVVIAGNGTLAAAQILEWQTINCTYVPADWSQQQITAYALADNATAELSSWDHELLQINLEGIQDIAGSLETLGVPFYKTKTTDVIDVEMINETDVQVELGQMWQLGRHRLICGDAREPENYKRLLETSKANLIWTDPPYGVNLAKLVQQNYRRATAHAGDIQNDDITVDDLTDLLRLVFGYLIDNTEKGAPWYVAAPSNPMTMAFAIPLHELGVWRHTLIWVKDRMVLGRSDYHYRHEIVYYGWSPGGNHSWYADRSQDSVFEIQRPSKSEQHPTMKPLELIAKMMVNSSKPNDLVLDPFLGSGSTLLAAEQLDRRCVGIDLEPRYCAVTITRWQKLTGEKAVLING
jgi:DNA modification methylase